MLKSKKISPFWGRGFRGPAPGRRGGFRLRPITYSGLLYGLALLVMPDMKARRSGRSDSLSKTFRILITLPFMNRLRGKGKERGSEV